MIFIKLCFILVIIFCTFHISSQQSNSLRVTLPNNSKLIGKYLKSSDGKNFCAFMGIPYAEPPIGNLRFRAPVPIKPWIGEREFFNDGNICTQWNPYLNYLNVNGSEDCLYLNVYTPENSKNVPVMVFFHGGAFIYGSGTRDDYGPEFLLNNDIIYIGANYRLGPLGFLSTGQKDCPGNFGFKDQVLVLKWVQKNIMSFGGDPNKVTIFGESAGAVSVTYLMKSLLSKDLFHRAISQSGTYFNPWAEPSRRHISLERALKLGRLVNCHVSEDINLNEFMNCLRSKSAYNITATYQEFYEWTIDPLVIFPPAIEEQSSKAFITEDLFDSKNDNGNKIPLLIGINLNEGLAKTPSMFFIPQLFADVQKNWTNLLPIILFYDHLCKDIQLEITRKINRFYFGNENHQINQNDFVNVTNLITDGWIAAGFDEYLKKRLDNIDSQSTYVYLLAHQGVASFTEIYGGKPGVRYGVCHGDDLQYLFPIKYFINELPSPTDLEVRKFFLESWIHFAYTGNPTPNPTTLQWKRATEYPFTYLRIGNLHEEYKPLFGMENDLWKERFQFWRELQAHLLN